MAMTNAIYDSCRLAAQRKFNGHVWDYEETFTSKERAQQCAQQYKEDGYRTRIVAGTYDNQYHLYTRKDR